jgi:hypothetical protein
MTEPTDGVTIRVHVERLLAESTATLAAVQTRVAGGTRLRPGEREEFRRQLAGVVAAVEAMRLWLAAGAP